MNKELLKKLRIDTDSRLEDILEELKDAQMNYLERSETANTQARKDEIDGILKEIDAEINVVEQQIRVRKSGIVLDDGTDIKEDTTKKDDSKQKEINAKIEEMKKRELQRQKAEESTKTTPKNMANSASPVNAVQPANKPQQAAPSSSQSAPKEKGLQEGLIEYRKGNYSEAFKIIKPLAENGDSNAQYLLSRFYKNGEGIGADASRADFWIKKAADSGNTEAQYGYAMEQLGKQSQINYDAKTVSEAFKYLEMAADKKNKDALRAYVNVAAKLQPDKSICAKAYKYCDVLAPMLTDSYDKEQLTATKNSLESASKRKKNKTSGKSRRSSRSGCGCFIWFLLILTVASIIYVQMSDYIEKAKEKNKNNSSSASEATSTTPAGPAFGEEVIELHKVKAVSADLVTDVLKTKDTYRGESWNGSFLYRAGNGKATAYEVYNVQGLFGKVSFKVHPYIGHEDFSKSNIVTVIVADYDNGNIISKEQVGYDTDTIEITADITGVQNMMIAVQNNQSGLGVLGYTMIKDAYIYPVEGDVPVKEAVSEFSNLYAMSPEKSDGVLHDESYNYIIGNKLINHMQYHMLLGYGEKRTSEVYWLGGKYEVLTFSVVPYVGNFLNNTEAKVYVMDDVSEEVLYEAALHHDDEPLSAEVSVAGHDSIKIMAYTAGGPAAVLMYDARLYKEPLSVETTLAEPVK